MSSELDEIRIGLIGPKSAGKTSIFQTFHDALDRGRHGFLRTADPQIRRTAEATPVEGLGPEDIIAQLVGGQSDEAIDREASAALSGQIAGTPPDQVVTRHFELSYREPGARDRRTVQLTITDAAGEHSFGRDMKDPTFKEYRVRLHRELGACDGFVVVVPVSQATDATFVRLLEGWLRALTKIAEMAEKAGTLPRQRRLVIALTRYDALFTDFGSEALSLAADPAVATDIINRLVRDTTNGTGYRNNIAKFDQSAGGRFRIVFVPTSSFGFVPSFGCVNLDPDMPRDDAISAIASGYSPEPFRVAVPTYPGQFLFPFLTADPFVFAATGLANPFIVPIDQALRQIPYIDRAQTEQFNGRLTEPPGAHPKDPGTGDGSSKGQPIQPPTSGWGEQLNNWRKRFNIDI